MSPVFGLVPPERFETYNTPDKLTLMSIGCDSPTEYGRNGVLLPGAYSCTSLSKKFATYKSPLLSTVNPVGRVPVGMARTGFAFIGAVAPLGEAGGGATGDLK